MHSSQQLACAHWSRILKLCCADAQPWLAQSSPRKLACLQLTICVQVDCAAGAGVGAPLQLAGQVVAVQVSSSVLQDVLAHLEQLASCC